MTGGPVRGEETAADALVRWLGAAKAAIDNGFTRVGPSFSPEGADRLLADEAGRLVRLSNALVLLCKAGHAAEAVPLVGRMASAAGAICREGASAGGVAEPDGSLEAAVEVLEDSVRRVGAAREAGIPWAHVFPAGAGPGPSAAETLRVAALAMERALRGLDRRWNGAFRVPEGLEAI